MLDANIYLQFQLLYLRLCLKYIKSLDSTSTSERT